jgi:hypothetical protein
VQVVVVVQHEHGLQKLLVDAASMMEIGSWRQLEVGAAE